MPQFWELNPYSFLEKSRIQDYSPESILINLKMWSFTYLDFKKARFLVSKYLTSRNTSLESIQTQCGTWTCTQTQTRDQGMIYHQVVRTVGHWHSNMTHSFPFPSDRWSISALRGHCTPVVPFSNSNSKQNIKHSHVPFMVKLPTKNNEWGLFLVKRPAVQQQTRGGS